MHPPDRSLKMTLMSRLTPTLAGLLALMVLATPLQGHAYGLLENQKLIAQSEGDDAYDPFADYSEFEESADEEEDINFFRNGRLLTVGFLAGYRGFIQTLGSIYSGSPTFGVFLSYFFDLRFAMQFSYITSDHTLSIPATSSSLAVQGNVNLSAIGVDFKYFLNTQNVTRGLADLNPYLIAGFSQVYRSITVPGNTSFAKDQAFAFDLGAGIEIPISRNKMYYGFQAMYQLINFSDKGTAILDANTNSTGVTPNGDSFTALAVLGVNF